MTTSDHEQRKLDQGEVSPAINYGKTARLVDAAMEHGRRPCRGGSCDLDDPCPRHRNTPAIVSRYVRFVYSIVKTCGCGERYSRLRWSRLEYAGEQGDHVERLELRHCHCGSTIARVIWRARCVDCGEPAEGEANDGAPICSECDARRAHDDEAQRLADHGDHLVDLYRDGDL